MAAMIKRILICGINVVQRKIVTTDEVGRFGADDGIKRPIGDETVGDAGSGWDKEIEPGNGTGRAAKSVVDDEVILTCL